MIFDESQNSTYPLNHRIIRSELINMGHGISRNNEINGKFMPFKLLKKLSNNMKLSLFMSIWLTI